MLLEKAPFDNRFIGGAGVGGCWGTNPRAHVCYANAPTVSYIPSPITVYLEHSVVTEECWPLVSELRNTLQQQMGVCISCQVH